MPQPQQVLDLAAELESLYRDAQDQIEAQLAAIAADPERFAQRRRLLAVQAEIDRLMEQLDVHANQAVRRNIEQTYEVGAAFAFTRAADIVDSQGGDASAFRRFSSIDTSAVDELVTGLHSDLLDATSLVSDSTKAMIRQAVRQGVGSQLIEGLTPGQATSRVEGFLEDNAVHAVQYANGAKVGIGDYASMAVRSVSALAYNQGVFDRSRDFGVEYCEVFDGPDCGWTDHDDGDLADGTIRSMDECEAFPISHPNCRRGFGPRPDVTSDEDAAAINDGETSGAGDGEGLPLDELAASRFGLPATPVSEAEPLGFQAGELSDAESEVAATNQPRSRFDTRLQRRADRMTARSMKLR